MGCCLFHIMPDIICFHCLYPLIHRNRFYFYVAYHVLLFKLIPFLHSRPDPTPIHCGFSVQGHKAVSLLEFLSCTVNLRTHWRKCFCSIFFFLMMIHQPCLMLTYLVNSLGLLRILSSGLTLFIMSSRKLLTLFLGFPKCCGKYMWLPLQSVFGSYDQILRLCSTKTNINKFLAPLSHFKRVFPWERTAYLLLLLGTLNDIPTFPLSVVRSGDYYLFETDSEEEEEEEEKKDEEPPKKSAFQVSRP